MSNDARKPVFGIFDQVQHKPACAATVDGLRLEILNLTGGRIIILLYYPCCENKGADQLRSYCEADLRLSFRIGQIPIFSRCGSNFGLILK